LGWIAMGYGPAERSQMRLIAAYRDRCTHSQEPGNLIYLFKRPFSAEFYSRGEALLAHNLSETETYLNHNALDCLAVPIKHMDRLPKALTHRFNTVCQAGQYYLLVEKG